jgi:anion-transporting  ArsA/GET3 family ATPase
MALSEKLMGGITSVTGFGALRSFGEFVLLMQEVIDGFHRTGERVLEILKRNSTSFVLVAAPHKAAARAAAALSKELVQMGYKLDGIVFNRCLPEAVIADFSRTDTDEIAILKTRAKAEDAVVQSLKSDVLRSQGGRNMWDIRIEDQSGDIHSLKGILDFSELYGGR